VQTEQKQKQKKTRKKRQLEKKRTKMDWKIADNSFPQFEQQ